MKDLTLYGIVVFTPSKKCSTRSFTIKQNVSDIITYIQESGSINYENDYKLQGEFGGISLYRVILVDDEPWTLMGITKTFKWEEKGFRVIKKTTKAREALEEILSKQPEVVFTDIRMPEMTGLELMKKARENGIRSEFVIISGFSEFAYAQEVILLKLAGFIIRTVNGT